jgi:agmatinase
MATVPTFALPPSFLAIASRSNDASFCIAGIPFDIGTTHRSGARFGPAAIRQASRMLVDGDHPQRWIDPAALSVADIGDFRIALGDIPASLALIEEQAAAPKHLIALGGDHTITLPLLRSAAKKRGGPLALMHFDAHVDTWPENFGQRYAHGSVFFHAIEEQLIDPRRAVQIGIRSPVQKAIHDWTIAKGVTIITAQDVHELGANVVAGRAAAVVGDAPTYLSFDIDALDPAFAPGTGTPEIGGLASWQIQAILRRLGGVDFVGMDIVEVSPPYDHAEITALAAATIVWEYLALVGGK